MTQVNGKRDYKHAYALQKKSGETKDFLERQKARQAYDAKGVDRSGKDIDHITPIRKGIEVEKTSTTSHQYAKAANQHRATPDCVAPKQIKAITNNTEKQWKS